MKRLILGVVFAWRTKRCSMSRVLLLVAAVVAYDAVSAIAQERVRMTNGVIFLPPADAPHPALRDFQLLAFVDTPTVLTMVSRSRPLLAYGWAFECRSGLQPSSQRVGDVGVSFDRGEVENYLPDSVRLMTGQRPDVQRAYAAACPAVGSTVGYAVEIKGLPPPGTWLMKVLWLTFDGAGRIIWSVIKRPIVVID